MTVRVATLFGLIGASLPLHAASQQCDQIASDVRSAITADPAKVLMVVEDALVINENCACEIVRAAILASKADAALVQHIVQTAIAVAPKMAPVITDCAGVAQGAVAATTQTPASGKGVESVLPEASGKWAKSVIPVAPPAVIAPVDDFVRLPADIRGIYLMAPGGVGFLRGPATTETEVVKKSSPQRPSRPTTPVLISPSEVVCR